MYLTEKEKLARSANKRHFASAHHERKERKTVRIEKDNAHVTPFAYKCALLSFSLSPSTLSYFHLVVHYRLPLSVAKESL